MLAWYTITNPRLQDRKYQIKYENNCISRNRHRIKITQLNPVILVSFSSAEDSLSNDVKKYDTFSSQGTENPLFHFFVSPEQRSGRDYAITFSVCLVVRLVGWLSVCLSGWLYVCDTLVKVFVWNILISLFLHQFCLNLVQMILGYLFWTPGIISNVRFNKILNIFPHITVILFNALEYCFKCQKI